MWDLPAALPTRNQLASCGSERQFSVDPVRTPVRARRDFVTPVPIEEHVACRRGDHPRARIEREEGFLAHPEQWDCTYVAEILAREQEGIEVLGDKHWAAIDDIRAYDLEKGMALMIRALCQNSGLRLREIDRTLFPSGLAKGACKNRPPAEARRLRLEPRCGVHEHTRSRGAGVDCLGGRRPRLVGGTDVASSDAARGGGAGGFGLDGPRLRLRRRHEPARQGERVAPSAGLRRGAGLPRRHRLGSGDARHRAHPCRAAARGGRGARPRDARRRCCGPRPAGREYRRTRCCGQ